jgi:branched-chain amino acid transport system permease protein
VSRTLPRHLAIAVAAGVILWFLSGALGQFDDLQLATMAYLFCAVAGLTVLTGLNGQISLGHGALMAVGAYTTAKVLGENGTGPPLVVALALGAVAGALAGVLAGAAAARLRGPYLAGATLTLAVGLPALSQRFPHFLGADNGLTIVPTAPPLWLGQTFPLERWQACIACLGALVVYVVLANLTRSRIGRSLRAVRDDEVAARLAGINVARTQVLAFVISSACAGLGGGLLVVVTGLAAPGAFALVLSVQLLTGAILGGMGRLLGAAIGAVLLVLIPQWADDLSRGLNLSGGVQANLANAVYGLVLILLMPLAPRGIMGALDRLTGFWKERSRGDEPRAESGEELRKEESVR